MKRKILIAGLLCLAMLAAGCGNGSAAADGSLTEGDVTTVKTDDGSYTVDKSAVLAEGKIVGDKKKIMDAVESYVLLFSRAYNGHGGVVDGDRIADSESALEHECDSRVLVLLAQGEQDDTRHDGVRPHAITYELLDIQDGAARVIVNYEPRKGMEPWREGYIFTQEGRDWQLVNVIVNNNGGGDAVADDFRLFFTERRADEKPVRLRFGRRDMHAPCARTGRNHSFHRIPPSCIQSRRASTGIVSMRT